MRLGIQWLRHLLAHGRLWRRLWLAPEPWPQPPPGLAIGAADSADIAVHRIGTVGGETLIGVSVDELRAAWESEH